MRLAAACGCRSGAASDFHAAMIIARVCDAGQQPGGLRERPGGRGRVGHRRQPRGQGRAGHAELGIPRGEAVPALRAVVPGAAQRDRAEDRVECLVPVVSEFRLMPLAAVRPRAAVAGVGGQQLAQHAAAQFQHPGAEHRLGGLQPRTVAAQRPGGLGGQPAYLGGLLRRERRAEPPLSPAGPAGEKGAAEVTGLASQIASFTATICSASAANSL
jgi:hypothetical protein